MTLHKCEMNTKMKYYQTATEKVLIAESEKDLVRQMRDSGAFSSQMTIEEFMRYGSDYWTGTYEIRTDTEEHFVQDKIKHGLIKVLTKAQAEKPEKLPKSDLFL